MQNRESMLMTRYSFFAWLSGVIAVVGIALLVCLPAMAVGGTDEEGKVTVPSLQNINDQLSQTGQYVSDSAKAIEDANSGEHPIFEVIGTIINLVSFFAGVVMAIMIIYAGFLWLLAGGNEEEITKSKTILKQAITGVIILGGAWSITTGVVYLVTQGSI